MCCSLKYIDKRGCPTEVQGFQDIKSAVDFMESKEIDNYLLKVEKDI